MPLPLDVRPDAPNQSQLPVTARVNAEGHLEIGGCDVVALAAECGTPLYIVDEATVRAACRTYREAFARAYPAPSLVLYASKAWSNTALCALVASEGLGVDVASGGELHTARRAGVAPARLYLHGNNKGRGEVAAALEAGVTLVADSIAELDRISALADAAPAAPGGPVRVMLRANPGIDVHAHEHVRTGQIDCQFGIGLHRVDEALAWFRGHPRVAFVGWHAHIGSQIFEVRGHEELADVMAEVWARSVAAGLAPTELNVGGGLGIRYIAADDPPTIAAWAGSVAAAVVRAWGARGLALPRLLCEPGRSIIGPACVTAYTVGPSRDIPPAPDRPAGRRYVMLDGGMGDNPRPITYGARYAALVADRPEAPAGPPVTLAGRHCETGDILIRDALLPAVAPGDVVVVAATGAYNASMASNYNRYPRAGALLVGGGRAEVILARESYADVVRQDRVPARLRGGR